MSDFYLVGALRLEPHFYQMEPPNIQVLMLRKSIGSLPWMTGPL